MSCNATFSPSPTQPRVASAPFDKPSADLIIRSADRVDFRVRSPILLEASPIFEDMFSLPRPPENTYMSDDRPVVDVAESSHTLDILLRMCYPIDRAPTRTIDDMEKALVAAIKYDMALPIATLSKELLAAANDRPLRVWAAACRLGLEEHARKAAEGLRTAKTLSPKVDPLYLFSLGDVSGITAGHYFRLCEFCRVDSDKSSSPTFSLLNPQTPVDCKQPMATLHPVSSRARSERNRNPSNVPFPDIICRSSDGQEFEAHRGVLSVISSVLHQKITALLGSVEGNGHAHAAETVRPLPILDLPETGEVVSTFLEMCYPSPTTVDIDLLTCVAVVTMAERYNMPRIRKAIMENWRAASWKDPVQAYFLAANAGWNEGAGVSARISLKQSLDGAYCSEMEDASAWRYHRLLAYHTTYLSQTAEVRKRVRIPDERLRQLSTLAFEIEAHSNLAPSSFNEYRVSDTPVELFSYTPPPLPSAENGSRIARFLNRLRFRRKK